jgi:hypothetical protein
LFLSLGKQKKKIKARRRRSEIPPDKQLAILNSLNASELRDSSYCRSVPKAFGIFAPALHPLPCQDVASRWKPGILPIPPAASPQRLRRFCKYWWSFTLSDKKKKWSVTLISQGEMCPHDRSNPEGIEFYRRGKSAVYKPEVVK